MGMPTARLLAESGQETYCYDLDADAMAAAERAGAVPVESVVDLAARCGVLVVMVPTDRDVLDVSGELAGAAQPETVLLVCSSVTVDTCLAVAELAEPRGIRVLDAALTGGVRAAETGRINLLVGGDEAVLDRIRPVLKPWTATVHHLGPLGCGQVGKTVNNLCHWGQLSAIVEAMRLGRALGVAPAKLRAAVLDGPAASRTLAEMGLFRLTWYQKDLANAMRMAAGAGRSLPLADAVRVAMEHITVGDIASLYADDPAGE
jgi:3-hydroxyisobutyrate dehydrogenase-like beta-hydroxyacid dehydrogenase